jgi:hypothetical protein
MGVASKVERGERSPEPRRPSSRSVTDTGIGIPADKAII